MGGKRTFSGGWRLDGAGTGGKVRAVEVGGESWRMRWWCWTIWLSPFCTTPIRQALTLNGETALLRAGHFLAELGPLTLKKVRDDAPARPAVISRQSRGQKVIAGLHNED